ncbi:MAG: adenosyl cobinamide kinase/adenosyl cobinamide phosphate guanylyltransferase [Gammaproteobacteria bacterium]|jgi:adenosyl cobinamide kinase/adenosyl cobinamide phosphate guanylyltransferase
MKELILGGARSGKSRLAEERAQATGLDLFYVATGLPGDGEMTARIEHHRQRRGPEWTLVEEPIFLAETLQNCAGKNRCIVVDCLTLWTSNCLLSNLKACWKSQSEQLLDIMSILPGHVIFVSNEVGMGIVPMGHLSRCFVDESGWMQQRMARNSDRVIFTIAGLPHILKGQLP